MLQGTQVIARPEWTKIRLQEWPSWLVSLMLHLSVLILLWQILLPLARHQIFFDFDFDAISGLQRGNEAGAVEGTELALGGLEPPAGDPQLDRSGGDINNLAADAGNIEPFLVPHPGAAEISLPAATVELEQPPEAAPATAGDGRGKAAHPAQRRSGGGKEGGANLAGMLDGRGQDARARLVKSGGGTKESEKAVELGLAWLARHQKSDGSWSFQHGPDDPGLLDCPTGATGLALLAFLGAGNTHKKGVYLNQVNGGLRFLLDHIDSEGWLMGTGQATMYVQGICAIALCEAYSMTKDAALKQPAQRAIDFIVSAQDPEGGGWRYRIPQAGDTSVLGWQLMALTSARVAELNVPSRTIVRATKFLKSVEAEGGAMYGYTHAGSTRPSTTAVGLLCRMYLGREQTNKGLIRGMKRLSDWAPDASDMYYSYYATQAMHHWGGGSWEKWNAVMRNQLVAGQAREGDAAGSWPTDASHGAPMGGRLYTTCLSIMTLEVYYRYLPVYRKQVVEEEL